MKVLIRVINPRNRLNKTINATLYTIQEVEQTFRFYMDAGFYVYLKREPSHATR